MHRRIISGITILMLILSQVLFSFPFSVPEVKEAKAAATIYIDNQLTANCTSGNYSIANRNCTGNNGNAYNNIAAAQAASVAGDTTRLRAGIVYQSNVTGEGIVPKNNQIWETHPGDLPTKAVISANGRKRVFQMYVVVVFDTTLRHLVLRDAIDNCIWAGGTQRVVWEYLECTNWNIGGDPM